MDIEKEMALYKIREKDNIDMKLQIESIETEGSLTGISYREKVQTSTSNADNGRDMETVERLKKKIKLNEIANKRVDNAISKILDHDTRNIVWRIKVLKQSRKQVQAEMCKSRGQIDWAIKAGINQMNFNNTQKPCKKQAII